MKSFQRFLWLLLILFIVENSFGQSYLLSFTSADNISLLDSVKVENLSLHTVLTLHNDTTLKLMIKKGNVIKTSSVNQGNPMAFEEQKKIISNDSLYLKMNYRDNDLLRITGYSAENKTVVMTMPRTDTTIAFHFTKCVDVDGNNYAVMQIGNQLWMTENLKTTRYRNGDMIEKITDKQKWNQIETGAYRNYFDMEKYVAVYGRLYNWYAVNDLRGLAPEGWRIPDADDWNQMENTKMQGDGGNSVGNILKEMALIPSGYCDPKSGFADINEEGFWWLSCDDTPQKAWYVYLNYRQSAVSLTSCDKNHGFSVRCVKDLK